VSCFSKDLAKLEDVTSLIDRKDPSIEIVLTGRGTTRELIEMADLSTEMENIKHAYDILGSSFVIAGAFLFFCSRWFEREAVLFRK
jgi:hypothetical protein